MYVIWLDLRKRIYQAYKSFLEAKNIQHNQNNSRLPKSMPEDILAGEEILKIIDAAADIRDKALIFILYASGSKVDEIEKCR